MVKRGKMNDDSKGNLGECTVSIVNLLNDKNGQEWDSFNRDDNLQLSYEYMKALFENNENNFEPYFIKVCKHDKVIAETYFFVDNKFYSDGILTGIGKVLYKMFPIKIRSVFVSSPIAEYNIIMIKDDYVTYEKQIVDLIMGKILEFSKKIKAKMVMVKDQLHIYESDVLKDKFRLMNFMPGTIIDLANKCHCQCDDCLNNCEESNYECHCFLEYVKSLKKHRRRIIKSKMKKRNAELQIKVYDICDVSEQDFATCHSLYLQTIEKQQMKHEVLSLGYWKASSQQLKDSAKMLIAHYDGKIVGFAQLIVNSNSIVNVRMGMDYTYSRDLQLYFHLLYENIIYTIRSKKRYLYTSQTCYRAKFETGVEILPLYTYVYFNNPLLRITFGKFMADSFKCYEKLIFAEKPTEILKKYKLCDY